MLFFWWEKCYLWLGEHSPRWVIHFYLILIDEWSSEDQLVTAWQTCYLQRGSSRVRVCNWDGDSDGFISSHATVHVCTFCLPLLFCMAVWMLCTRCPRLGLWWDRSCPSQVWALAGAQQAVSGYETSGAAVCWLSAVCPPHLHPHVASHHNCLSFRVRKKPIDPTGHRRVFGFYQRQTDSKGKYIFCVLLQKYSMNWNIA